MTLDGIGYHGFLFHYTGIFLLFGTAVLLFLYFWYNGRLDMEEEIKYQVFEGEKENE